MSFFSDSLKVKYDDELKSIVITHPNQVEFPHPFVQVREETYSEMKLTELAEFIGMRLLLLMPKMRNHFKDEIDQMANRDET